MILQTLSCFLLVFITGKLISNLIAFNIIRQFLSVTNEKHKIRAVFKGIIERFVIFLGLIYHFPQILIAFGALKIATRFPTDKEQRISNDYFFFGNFTSIFFAILYAVSFELIMNNWIIE